MTPASILDALMQGTGRRPISPGGVLGEGLQAGEANIAPRLLALAVQAQLHALPTTPGSFDAVTGPSDPRPIVPEVLRPQILRLVTGKGNPADDPAALALALALGERGVRVHPFDRPRLEPFVRKHAEILGVEAAQVEEGSAAGGYWLIGETLDLSNWTLATPARKAAFIAELRGSDPARARELVEAQLPLEKAEVRLRLIDALATGLGSDDRPFLEGLAGDRAPTVKQAVTRLLARLPGTGAAAAQIEELVSRITVGKTGLLRKRTTFKLQLPANLRGPAPTTDWLAANFGSVGAGALAEAFGLSADAMLDAARDDDALVQGIAYSACAARDWNLLATIAAQHAPSTWTEFLQPGLGIFGLVSVREREDWIKAVMPGSVAPTAINPWVLTLLHQTYGGPLPLGQARAVFSAAMKAGHPSSELFTAATALMPVAALGEVRAALSRTSSDLAARAALLADIILILNQEATRP